MDVIPISGVQQQQHVPGLPSPARDQQDALGKRELSELANETRDFHQRGLASRRLMNLTAEKLMIHADGEGTSQWLDLHRGVRLKMAPNLLGLPRVQNNQMRPILTNFVAHLTTRPFRVVVKSKNSREAKERAAVDQALINTDIRQQRWNQLWAEAKAIAACTGFCPIHAMWRDDPVASPYEAVMATMPGPNGPTLMQGPKPGDIDCWVGDPLNTVFDGGSKFASRHRMTYGRWLPADMVREQFGRGDIEGTDKLVSASLFQRVIDKWKVAGSFVHGTPALTTGPRHDEMVHLIYDEWMPGYHPRWPQGRLSIVAVQGSHAGYTAEYGGNLSVKHLWTGPLPARRFGNVLVYSHHRFDDIHGKAYLSDIDDDQIELNQLESLYDDFVRRATRPPLGSTGAITVDTLSYTGDTLLEMEPLVGGGAVELRYLEYPARHMPLLAAKIERVQEGMYRKAGWQASSRGESQGESGKAIIALQQADDTLFGPIQAMSAAEVEEMAELCWHFRKEFMDVPMVLEDVGDELAHLADEYVDRTRMSERAPLFTLVSGFGTSVEAEAQQLLNLFGMTDARGEQVIGTRELKKLWPDNSLFGGDTEDAQDVRERRAKAINQAIRDEAKNLRQQFPQLGRSMADPVVAQAGQFGALNVDAEHPIMIDDDLVAHIEALSMITQNHTEDPLARRIAEARQAQYYQWVAMQQSALAPPPEPGASGPSQNGGPSTAEAFHPEPEASTEGAAAMVRADQQFSRQVRSA